MMCTKQKLLGIVCGMILGIGGVAIYPSWIFAEVTPKYNWEKKAPWYVNYFRDMYFKDGKIYVVGIASFQYVGYYSTKTPVEVSDDFNSIFPLTGCGYGIVVDSQNNIYVSVNVEDDNSSYRKILKYKSDGTFIKSWQIPKGRSSYVSLLIGMGIDSNDNIYYGAGNGIIYKYSSEGTEVQTITTYKWGGQSNCPITDVAIAPNGNIYALLGEENARSLQIFKPSGTLLYSYGRESYGYGSPIVGLPSSGENYGGWHMIDVDAQGNAYITQYYGEANQNIIKVTPDGNLLWKISAPSGSIVNSSFHGLGGICVDKNQQQSALVNVYVNDFGAANSKGRIIKFSPTCSLPPSPTLSIELKNDGRVTLKWNKISSFTIYLIQESQGDPTFADKLKVISIDTTCSTNPCIWSRQAPIITNDIYYYRVRAFDGVNMLEGEWSNVVLNTVSANEDFTLSSTGLPYQRVKQEETARWSIDITSNGFTTPVSLSINGHPSDTTPSFSNNATHPPFSSLLSISTLPSTSPNNGSPYKIVVTGRGIKKDETVVEKTLSLSLYVYKDSPNFPILNSPSNESELSGSATFEWSAVNNASGYELVIGKSSDPAINPEFESGMLGTTKYSLPDDKWAKLSPGTYYWSVRAAFLPIPPYDYGPYAQAFSFEKISTNSLKLQITPTETQTVIIGQEVTFSISVKDTNGGGVKDVIIRINDQINGFNGDSPWKTDADGNTTYTTKVPQNKPSGQYIIIFGPAKKLGYSNSRNITRIMHVSSPQDNKPPYVHNPQPVNGTTNVCITTTLSWQGEDPDIEDVIVYDVYFGTQTTPPLVATNLAITLYNPGELKYNTTYYWQIVAKDNRGSFTVSPLWAFTTAVSPLKIKLLSYYPDKGIPSEVMEGGKIFRCYKIVDSMTSNPIPNFSFNYKFSEFPDYRYNVISDEYGFVAIETEWLKLTPNNIYTFTIISADSDIIIDNSDPNAPTNFGVMVSGREFEQSYKFLFGLSGEVGVGGPGFKLGPIKAKTVEAGIKLELAPSLTIAYEKSGKDLVLTTGGEVSLIEEASAGLFAKTFKMKTLPKVEIGVGIELSKALKGWVDYKFEDFFNENDLQHDKKLLAVTGLFLESTLYTQPNLLPIYGFLVSTIAKDLDPDNFGEDIGFEMCLSDSFGVNAGVTLINPSGSSLMRGSSLGLNLVGINGESAVSFGDLLNVKDGSSEFSLGRAAKIDVGILSLELGQKFGGDKRKKDTPEASLKFLEGIGGSIEGEEKVIFKNNISPSIEFETALIDTGYDWFTKRRYKKSTSLILGNINKFLPNYIGIGRDFLENITKRVDTTNVANLIFEPQIVPQIILDSLLVASSNNDMLVKMENKVQKENITEVPLEIGATLKVKLGAGIKIEVADSIEYKTEDHICSQKGLVRTTEYMEDDYITSKKKDWNAFFTPIQNRLNKLVDETLQSAQKIIDSTVETAVTAIDNGAKVIAEVSNNLNNFTVSISSFITPAAPKMKAYSVMAMKYSQKGSPTTTSAKTIGKAYFVNLKNSSGNFVEEFPSPLKIFISYSKTDLTSAGYTLNDAQKLKILFWDETQDSWVYQGGEVNTTEKNVSVYITRPGSYILAIDESIPEITKFKSSNSTPTPVISAKVLSSLIGIDGNSIKFYIDDQLLVDNTNWSYYFNKITGEFNYEVTTPLVLGDHLAKLIVADSMGRAARATLTFTVAGTSTASPLLSVSPTLLDFGEVKKEEGKTLSFTIKNNGSETLSGRIYSYKGWITITPASFNQNDITISVTVKNDNLNDGEYNGDVNITSNGGNAIVSIKMTATCVITKPSPFFLSKHQKITFFGSGVVPYDTKIKIYTLSRDLVKEIEENQGKDELYWDGRTEGGQRVVPGIYLYTHKSPKEKGYGKIIIIK